MALFLLLPIAAVSFWILYSTIRRMRRGKYSKKWWRVFAALAGSGASLGVWLAGFVSYSPAKGLYLQGFPVPVIFHRLIDGRWIETPLEPGWRFAGYFVNWLFGVALCVLPLFIIALLKEFKEQTNAE